MRIAVFWAGRAKRSFSVFWKAFFLPCFGYLLHMIGRRVDRPGHRFRYRLLFKTGQ